MDYIEVKLKRGIIKYPVVANVVFSCPNVKTCKAKYCYLKGGKETPTLESVIKNANLILYCMTGGSK